MSHVVKSRFTKIRDSNHPLDSSCRVTSDNSNYPRRVAFSEEVRKQSHLYKMYTNRWNSETTKQAAGNPWSEEELKLPRYMRSTASSRQRLKENMLSNGAKSSSQRVSHRRTVPVLHSEREAFQKYKRSSNYPYREQKESNSLVINDNTDYQTSNETVVEELKPRSESNCVAIKRRLTS